MSSSPITSDDFPNFNPAADLCTKIDQLFGISEKLKIWFDWAFDENGNWTEDAKAQIVESGTPVGTLLIWPSGSLPDSHWLLANGAEVSRTTYSVLYSRIGTRYGAGNGSSTFNLPDLTSRFPVGSGADPLASTGGERSVALVSEEIPDHFHTVPMDRFDATDRNSGGQKYYVPDQPGSLDSNITTTMPTTPQDGDPHENMPPFLSVNYIIRAL